MSPGREIDSLQQNSNCSTKQSQLIYTALMLSPVWVAYSLTRNAFIVLYVTFREVA
jgi:hypothetical protein